MTNTWGYKTDKIGCQLEKNVNKNLVHYQYKLNNTKIKSHDYKKVTMDNDGKNVFFYVDPPYHKAIDYNQPVIDPKEVAKIYNKCKGKVMISYNDHPDVHKAFPKKDGWRYRKITLPYTLQHPKDGNGRKNVKELLITNY